MLTKAHDKFLETLLEHKLNLEGAMENGNLYFILKDEQFLDRILIPVFNDDHLFEVVFTKEEPFTKYNIQGFQKQILKTKITTINDFCYYYFRIRKEQYNDFKNNIQMEWNNLFLAEGMFDKINNKDLFKRMVLNYFLNTIDIKKTYFSELKQ
jgi:hypothetical protein